MIEAKTTELLDVPEDVAVCPECQAPLVVDIYEYETDSKLISDSGFHIHCKHEFEECFVNDNWEAEHRGWQGEWYSTNNKVSNWLTENVRVNNG